MKCPHCRVEFHEAPTTAPLGSDCDGKFAVIHQICPACKHLILELAWGNFGQGLGRLYSSTPKRILLLYPRAASRPKPPPEVPDKFAEDYIEASLVLADSPKASAALSRRCLQHVLREEAKVKPGDLYNEIQEVLDSKALPAHLAEDIDAIRRIGNFAAHPSKSKTTGEVVPVEPGEADWNLDVLAGLFDFYFVLPAMSAKRRAALDVKTKDIDKPR